MKKTLLFAYLLGLFSSAPLYGQFITTWQTDADDTQLTIPAIDGPVYNYNVYWENVNNALDNGTLTNQAGSATMTGLTSNQTYRVEVTGIFPAIYFNDAGDKDKILTVEQWGDNVWSYMNRSFYGCTKIQIPASDSPDLSGLIGGNKSLQYMFTGAINMDEPIDHWDVSNVNDFFRMFSGATSFNQPLNNWDVSSATSFSHMFEDATNFNQPLGNWNPTGLTAIKLMFKNASNFNQPVNHFDVDQVTDFAGTFEGATSFNQPLNDWDVGSGQIFGNMFFGASAFNQSLGDWDISSATSFGYMIFNTAISTPNYDKTLIGWASLDAGELQIPGGLTMYANLTYCDAVNARNVLTNPLALAWTINNDGLDCAETYFVTTWQTDNTGTSNDDQITIPTTGSSYDIYWEEVGNEALNNGTVSNILSAPTITFPSAGTYRVEISGTSLNLRFENGGDKDKILTIEQWGTIQWSWMYNAYGGCTNLTIPATDAPDLTMVTDARSMFENATSFNSPIDHWDVSSITDMDRMFRGASIFNQDLNSWDVRNVTDMSFMFQDAIAFNGNVSAWQLDNLNSIQQMFSGATAFNQPIGGWDVSGISTFYNLFYTASSFNQDLNSWNVQNASVFDQMFAWASSFNQDLNSWVLTNAMSMSGMFRSATAFNGNISNWNVSGVGGMAFMFYDADAFNADISGWQVGNVSAMNSMFGYTTLFNQNIANWNVSNVQYMHNMFHNTDAFNQDISGWNTEMVSNFSSMFAFADVFDQDVSGWNTSSATNMSNMFQNAVAFDQDLGGWDIGLVSNMTSMLSNSGMSLSNYDASLIGWEDDNSGLETVPSTITLGATGLNYCDAASARQNLINTHGWIFSDAGQSCGLYTVVNTNDTGSGSLRWAIENANSSASKEIIEFNITGSGPWVISPTTALPIIDNANDMGMIIDGTSQPGWGFGDANTMVTIDGSSLLSAEYGLEISDPNVEIYGLIVTNFTGGFIHGIEVNAGSDNFILGGPGDGNIVLLNGSSTGHGVRLDGSLGVTIQGNRIGTTVDGLGDGGNGASGLLISNCDNLLIGGNSTLEEGNLISGNQNGIIMSGSDNVQIFGNLIGTDEAGTNPIPQSIGLTINGGNTLSIGGTGTGQGNVISGNNSRNLSVSDGSSIVIENNIIGLDENGDTKVHTTNAGIYISSDGAGNIIRGNTISGNNGPGIDINGVDNNLIVEDNLIGTALDGTGFGTDLVNVGDGISIINSNGTDNVSNQINILDNVISGNGSFSGHKGIDIWTSSNIVIKGNMIGVELDRSTVLGNAGPGIKLGDQVSNVTIGGMIPAEQNIISNSQGGANGFGIEFEDNTGGDEIYATNIDVLQNLIYCNQGRGIDYAGAAPIEAPIINVIRTASIEGTTTAPDGSTVYIYEANDGCNNDQGATLLGTATSSGGDWSLSGSFTETNSFSAFVYATDGNISPFGVGMVVVNTNDLGTGSMRDVLATLANINAPGLVTFNIPGAAPWNINLATALPDVTANEMVIDGTTQDPSWDINSGEIVTLNGGGIGSSGNGLTINASEVEIYGLQVSGFPDSGIAVVAAAGNDNNIIGAIGKGNVLNNNTDYGLRLGWASCFAVGNRIGTNAQGTMAAPNGNGIAAGNTSTITDNLISGNTGNGVFSNAANNHVIRDNRIGTDISGATAIANNVGIVIVTGGNSTVDNNLISGNTTAGIWSNTGFNGNDIINNIIGLDATATSAIPNGAGISFVGGTGNRIGYKDNPNIIAGNTGNAIEATRGNAGDLDNTFVTNEIYNNGDGIVLATGTNGDIATPSINATSSSGASGTGPEGATIHLYLADALGQGEIFLDSTEVSGGTWSIAGLSLSEVDELVATSTEYGGAAGTSEFSTSLALSPNAPSNLFTSEVTTTQIDLSWTDNSTEEINFAIFRSIGNNSSYIEIGTTSSDITTYSDNTVSPDNNYFYFVVARNADADSGPTNEKAAATFIQPGNALVFDGSDDYVSILDDASLQFGAGDFSLELWFYFDGSDIRQTLISKRNTVIPFDQYFIAIGDGFINSSTGKILYAGVLPDNRSGSGNEESVDRIVSSPDDLSLGWHHVALVQDYSDGLFLYLDGVNISSDSDDHLGGVANANGHDLTLGASSGTLLNFGNKMDEVRVWNDVRSEAEIQANMLSDLNGDEANLIAYYKFDQTDPTVTVLPDRSLNSNDGVLTNLGGAAGWVVSGAMELPSPKVFNASEVSIDGFTANFSVPINATDILLDVDDDADFSSPISVDFSAGTSGSFDVNLSLIEGLSYYYRLQTDYGFAQSKEVVSNEFKVTPGNALHFDGLNDVVVVPDDDILDFGSGDFTVEIWVNKLVTTTGYLNTYAIDKWMNQGLNPGQNEWSLSLASGIEDDFPTFVVEEGTTAFKVSSNEELKIGTWQHIAGVREGTDLKIYVDGVLKGTTVIPGGTIVNNVGRDLLIGHSAQAINLFTEAIFDEARVWNVAKTELELKTNMLNTLIGNESGLVAYYRFDQGSAEADNSGITTFKDYSSNGHDGTLNNFALTGNTSNWVSSRALLDQNQFFITTWKTDNSGTSNDNQITIPTNGTISTYDIYWEEVGNETTNGTIQNATGDYTITFPTAGAYRVKISGAFPRIYFNATGDRLKILTIEQWGDINWTSMENAFFGCTNLTSTASDVPNLTAVSSLAYMFRSANLFDLDISSWDLTSITDLTGMFYGAISFNNGGAPLDWGVTTQNVNFMSDMFRAAYAFDQDINSWDVSEVTQMDLMFKNATIFNRDVGSWNVSNVTNMAGMFNDAEAFNNGGAPFTWTTGTGTQAVLDMSFMFDNAVSFNQDISDWDVISVTTMWGMFSFATAFNNGGVALDWGASTQGVTIMQDMFIGASSFNQDISSWDVSSVTTMRDMFDSATSFDNGGVSLEWVAGTGTQNVISMENMLESATSFNQDISSWDVSSVQNFAGLLYLASAFDQSLASWDISSSNSEMYNMLNNTSISVANYDATLIGWLDDNGGTETIPVGIELEAQGVNFCNATFQRQTLIDTYGWTIDDAGADCSVTGGVVAEDHSALLALYNSTDGANWIDNANWLLGDVSSWYGISVSMNRVTDIVIESNNLNGTIPPEIGNLSGLLQLDLEGNILTGDIPIEVSDLSSLTELDLSGNQFTSSIPMQLGELTNLEDLNLSANALTGSIPPEIGNLTSLVYLNLQENQILGSIPAEIGNLTNLIELRLEENQLSGSIPSEIGNLTNLTDIRCDDNQLTGVIPSVIGNLTQLVTVELGYNQLTGPLPITLGNLTDMQEFNVWNNQIDGSIPTELGQCTALIELNLDRNQFSGSIPSELGDLTNLQILTLWENQLSGPLPTELGNLTFLTELQIHNNNLTGSIPIELGNLTSLTRLWLNSNQLTGSIPSELESLVVLDELRLNDNQLIGSVPSSLTALSVITNLEVDHNQLTDLPDLSPLTGLIDFEVQDNNFEFDDIESNVGISGISYSPQGNITGPGDMDFEEGEDLDVTITVGGANNVYQWIKDDIDLSGQNSNQLIIQGLTPSDNGIYSLRITNSVATELTLLSEEFAITVNAGTAELAVFEGTDNSGTEIINGQASVIDVGTAYQGTDTSIAIAIENTGNTTLNISAITSIDASFVISNSPTSVIAGETEFFEVTLSGLMGGIYNSTLTIENDDADESSFQFTITGEITPLFNGILEQDFNALVALYNAADGSNWVDNTNWLSENPVDTWFGVTIVNYEVVNIDLSNNGLSGDLGDLMNNLQAIQTLDLSGNLLVDLPDLSGLTQLTTLSIDDNLLHFDDIEENIGIASITYSPQGMISSPADLTLNVGDEMIEKIAVGGSSNLYQWTKDAVSLVGQTTDQIIVSDLVLSDAGFYQLEITSSIVTGLTLLTDPFELSVIDTTSPELNLFRGDDIAGTAISTNEVELLDFGSSNQGFDLTELFTIENTGTADLNISSISSSNISFSIIDAPTIVSAGMSENFAITLSSGMVGIYSSEITIMSDDSDEGTFNFSVSGEILSLNIPVAAIATTSSLCLGEEVTLTASGASTYVWDNGVVDGVSFVPDATTTYTVIGTDDFGNVGTGEITITVNPIPTVMANVTASDVCLGDEVVFSGSGADSYVWDNGVVDGELFSPSETNDYMVVGTDLNGCSSDASVQVTVNKVVKPKISVVSDNGRNIVFTSTEADSYQWYESDGMIEGETSQTLEVERTYFFGGDYSVEISEGECTNISDVFNNPILSTETKISSQISIWPNPVSDILFVKLKTKSSHESELVIMDFSGRTIEKSTHNQLAYEISLSELKKGVYLIQLKQGSEVYSETLVVE